MFMAPEYVMNTIWFIAAIPVASLFYYLSDHNKRGIAWSVVITIILVVLNIGLYLNNDAHEKEVAARTPVSFGFLEPSDEPPPAPLPAKYPPDVMSLWMGNDLRVLSRSTNMRIFQINGKPFLSIGNENDKMWISATISDSENQTVVRIIKNEFQTFPEHAFNPTQPDSHSLLVRDSTGIEVLKLRFLNPRCILLYGKFVLPDSRIVTVDDNGIRFPPGGGGFSSMTIDVTSFPRGGMIDFGNIMEDSLFRVSPRGPQ
jgi:hypothetical protein